MMPDKISSASSVPPIPSVESRASWVAASVALALLSVAYGSTLLVVVGPRVIARQAGDEQQARDKSVAGVEDEHRHNPVTGS